MSEQEKNPIWQDQNTTNSTENNPTWQDPSINTTRQAAAPQQPHPVFRQPINPPIRRVGTLTLGIGLIATGIVAMIAIFNPTLNLFFIIKLFPLLLVFLGVEILVNYFRHKDERIRVDFLSGFFSFLLICGALVLAIIPTIWGFVGPPAYEIRETLSDQAEEAFFERFKENPHISSAHVSIHLPHIYRFDGENGQKLAQEKALYRYYINLSGPFEDEKAFAAVCREILDQFGTLSAKPLSINLSSSRDGQQFSVYLDDRFEFKKNVEQLAEMVTSNTQPREDSYSSESYAQDEIDQKSEPAEKETDAAASELDAASIALDTASAAA